MATTTEMTTLNGDGAMTMPTRGTDASDARRALMPQNYTEAFSMATHMAKSGMFGIRTPEMAVVILMTGMEIGIPPATALRGISVIQNRPSPDASTLLAVCLAHPSICAYFYPVRSDDQGATYRTQRLGNPAPFEWTFTMEMARRAGLDRKDTWKAHPEAMLRARCIAHVARMIYPDLCLGLYIPDEAEDIPTRAAPPARPALEDTHVTRDAMPPEERTPAAQRQAPPAPNNSNPNNGGMPACTDCGKVLTKSQQELSVRNFGAALCPGCQRDKPRSVASAPTPPAPAASAPEQAATGLSPWEEAIRIMDAYSAGEKSAAKQRWTLAFGESKIKSLDLPQIQTVVQYLHDGIWPYEADFQAEQNRLRASEEPDPFADPEPLLVVPAGKGHGDS